jgi:hypothetical protein
VGPVTILLGAALLVAADEPGRGDDPGGVGGVLIVVGIAVLVALIAAGALFLVSRARSRQNRRPQTTRAPLPSEEGRPWSSER